MDLIKLLPILFVVAQGEGRPVDQHTQVLPAIPGYVPVYIQQGPDVEVIYETGRRVAVHDSPKKDEEVKEADKPNAVDLPQEPVEEEQPAQQVVQEKEPVDQQKAEQPAEPAPPPSTSEEQQNIIHESGAPAEAEDNTKKEDSSQGVGTVQEIGKYQVKERK